MSISIDAVLLGLLLVCAIAIVASRNLFGTALLLGCYSFFLAILWALWSAPDVAFTEAVVGAGIATILFLTLLWIMPHDLPWRPLSTWSLMGLILLMVLAAGGGLAILHLPPFGDPQAAPHLHVVPAYLRLAYPMALTPNVVTAVLADFRGFDTLIETTVVFAAGMACWLLGDRHS